jgi:hypothetical protein
MAANLCSSFFVLTANAGEASKLGIIQSSFGCLRSIIETALNHLSDNVISALSGDEDLDEEIATSVLTVSTIVACERACAAFSETEVMLSRAVSLLNKYPGRYDLAERMLKSGEDVAVGVRNPDDRSAILELVENQQRGSVPPGQCPEASISDYLLRSVDNPLPSQLLVRCCSDRDEDGTLRGSLAIAIFRCSRD